jgi:hypothetical protein
MDEFTTPPVRVEGAAAQRPAPASLARIGLLGIAAAALIAAAILALGWVSAPSSLLAAGSTGTEAPAVVDDLHPGRPGGPGFGRLGGITITAISGNSISLATVDGWTRTITVDSGTTYSKSGETIALGDLEVGDRIAFRQTREDDGSFTIDAIAVILPRLGGEVTAVSGSTITVTKRDGTTGTITVNGDTTYTVNGNGASLADVKVGMLLVAEGTLNDDGSLVAANVHARDAGVFGGRAGHGPRNGFGAGPGWGDGVAEPDGLEPSTSGAAS